MSYTPSLRILVPDGRRLLEKNQTRFSLIDLDPTSMNYEERNYPREVIRGLLWVGGIAAVRNESAIRAMNVDHIVLLRLRRAKTLRTRYVHLVTYSEYIIDDDLPTSSLLSAAHFVALKIIRGERVFLHETVLSTDAKHVCGLVLQSISPKVSTNDALRHLNDTRAFSSTHDGPDLATLNGERVRLASLRALPAFRAFEADLIAAIEQVARSQGHRA